MEIKITIEKKYVWLLVLTLVVVGLVVAYGGNEPQKMGHSFGEVFGAARNCESNPQHAFCQQVNNWLYTDVAISAAMAWDSLRLGNISADQFCRKDGNCLGAQQQQNVVYKRAVTEQCSNTGFLCPYYDSSNVYGRQLKYAKPTWYGSNSGFWARDVWAVPVPSGGAYACLDWVLCIQ